jgi:hypothetical protein
MVPSLFIFHMREEMTADQINAADNQVCAEKDAPPSDTNHMGRLGA